MTNNDDLYLTKDFQFTSQAIAQIELTFEILSKACFLNSEAHGWYDQYTDTHLINGEDQKVLGQRNFGEVIALITSELSEALEAYRDGDDQTKIHYKSTGSNGEPWKWEGTQELGGASGEKILGKPEGIASELADAIIRILDYAGAYNIPLAKALIQKHAYNVSRPYRHGGKIA